MSALQAIALGLVTGVLLFADRKGWTCAFARVFGLMALAWVAFGGPDGVLGLPPADSWPTAVAGMVLLVVGADWRLFGRWS